MVNCMVIIHEYISETTVIKFIFVTNFRFHFAIVINYDIVSKKNVYIFFMFKGKVNANIFVCTRIVLED